MRIENQIILILLSFVFSFVYIRVFLNGAKRYAFNTKAYRKIKKTETIRSWLLYEKYKHVFPCWLIMLYYFIIISHIFAVLLCIIANFYTLTVNIGEIVAKFIACFDAAWIIILALLFWSPRPGFAYARWIKKRGK